MANYAHVIAAVDLKQHSNQIMRCAASLAERFQARLTLLHVVEYIPVDPGGDTLLPAPVELSDDLVEQARRRLADRASMCEIGHADQLVFIGNIKAEIMRAVRDQEADLVVIGNHERHGVAVLLNYTEDTILHEAPCDILAVRLTSPPP